MACFEGEAEFFEKVVVWGFYLFDEQVHVGVGLDLVGKGVYGEVKLLLEDAFEGFA